jgi:uncharacterized protein YfaS (alpha-2-macroglobulin family)
MMLRYLNGRRARLTILVAVGLVACLDAAKPPATSGGTLAPDLTERGNANGGRFRVVFASPKGQVDEGVEIGVVFDRALRPLDRADAIPPPIKITPAVDGSARWVGTRAISFAPKTGQLPSATEFKVEIPAETRALDGSALGTAYTFSFQTPRPKLVSSEPGSGARGVLPTTPIDLHFNQDVSVESVQRFGSLKANGKSYRFKASRENVADQRTVHLKVEGRFPLATDVTFELSPSFVGLEGPLSAEAALTTGFRTYEPLVVSASCPREDDGPRCYPNTNIELSFSNAVRFSDLKRAVSVTPAAPGKWPEWLENDSMVTNVELPGRYMSAAPRVTVQKGLKDEFGQSLGQDFGATLAFDDPFPRMALGITDGTLRPTEREPIPVAALNVKAASVVAAPLGRSDVQRLFSGAAETALSELVLKHGSARRTALPRGATPTTVVRSQIDPFGLLPSGGFGVLGLVADYARDPRDYDGSPNTRLAKVSDLALTGKFSSHGSYVWVTRLSTAEPVQGAEVSINQNPKRYQTDSTGGVYIPASDFVPSFQNYAERSDLVYAASGNDWTFESLGDVLPSWQLPVTVDYWHPLGVQGLLFTERGVYRPGDTIRVKGVVRRETARGSAIPKGESIQLVLNAPTGEQVTTQKLVLSELGTFHADMKVPAAGALGGYQLVATLGDRAAAAEGVEVREYVPAEFQVDVEAPKSLLRGDVLHSTIEGTYLYGASMRGAAAQYYVSRSPTYFSPPNAEGFDTDASDYYHDLRDHAIGAGNLKAEQRPLDESGKLQVTQPLALPNQSGPELVTIDAEITDLSRRSQASRASVLVHPGEFYLGVQVPETFANANSNLAAQVIAIAPDGQRRAGVRVKLELVQRRWTFAREDRGGPYPQTVSKLVDQTVASCEVTTTQKGATCPLAAKDGGYYIVRARSRDGRKNPIEAAAYAYVFGQSEARFPGRDDGRVELVLDKKSYRVGEKARVLVKSPFPEARAFISVERSSVLSQRQQLFSGSMPSFEVEVTEDFVPNAFVSVHLVRKIGKGEVRPGGAYRVGYVEIPIDPEPRRLGIDITPNRKVLTPGEELSVDLAVRDKQGKPARAELTVFAVDEGVLMLTGYTVPDPLLRLSQPRPLGVATLETRAALAKIIPSEIANLLGVGKGDEGGGGGESATRSDFRQTAYFNPRLMTDAQGKASVKFKLPDSLTTYRLMAVAVGDAERYGFGSTSVTARKQLMARPALPRFIRTGDRVEAGVVVATSDLNPGEVNVRVEVSGLVVDGPSLKTVKLKNDEQAEVRFAFRAEKSGEARLVFDASGGGGRDRVEVRRPVSAPTVLESVAAVGHTEGVATEALGKLTGIRGDVGGLEVSVASTALVGLESALNSLMEYPYGCTEQLSSRLLPLLPLRDLSEAFGIKPAAPVSSIERTVREIVARQTGDGGFMMWPESGRAYPWVSAYALWVLSEAKARKVQIPESVITAGKSYLRGVLATNEHDVATQAFVLDVLAALGDPDVGYMNKAFERRKDLPLFGKALLLSALVRANQRGSAEKTLIGEIEQHLHVSAGRVNIDENLGNAYARVFDSTVRTQSLVLMALARSRPDHALIGDLARELLFVRKGGTWRTTQETAYALLALDTYRKQREKTVPDFEAEVSLGGETLFAVDFEGRSLQTKNTAIPIAALLPHAGDPLLFERDGEGTLHYQARLRYARKDLPTTGFDSGFYIEKRLHRVTPEELQNAASSVEGPDERQFAGGALVASEIMIVTSAARHFVVVDDALPAGFEAVDTTLATASALAAQVDNDCVGCDRDSNYSLSSAARRELRDDRALFFVDYMGPGIHRFRYLARATTLGKFVVPPLRAEEMYAPESFGRTGAITVEVR